MKLLAMTLFTISITACTATPPEATQSSPITADVGPYHLEPAAPAASSPATADDPSDGQEVSSQAADTTDPSADVITPRAGCSVVQFCNAPGSDGTRCVQQGCTLEDAFVECLNETASVCGQASCPWILVESSGARDVITPCP